MMVYDFCPLFEQKITSLLHVAHQTKITIDS